MDTYLDGTIIYNDCMYVILFIECVTHEFIIFKNNKYNKDG